MNAFYRMKTGEAKRVVLGDVEDYKTYLHVPRLAREDE
jgi:hypothetical protein